MDFKKFSDLIMIEQTMFALPFALTGVLFAQGGSLMTWIWVIIALTSARTAGMSFNRVIDAEIDAKNPRTSDRAVPKGHILPGTVWITACASSLILIGSSFMLNRLCFYLSFPAVLMLFTYPYFKRFSSSSHFYLGLVEAAAPIGGYIAVAGKFTMVPFVLGFVIMAWIAGLDIIYAIQDMEFDKKEKLFSMPAILGKDKSLNISAGCYILSISGMVTAGVMTHKAAPYWIALFLIGIIFVFQQKLARGDNLEHDIQKIFKVNMYISFILFLGTLLSVMFF